MQPSILRAGISVLLAAVSTLSASEDWEATLKLALRSEYSQTRQDGIKGIDTKSRKGLQVLWKVLASTDADRIDWYVREGAYEALMNAEGQEAEEEIERVLEDRKSPLAKEAIVYSVVWKIRKEFVKAYGGNDDRKMQEAKYLLRTKRGLEYFALVLPTIQQVDPDGKWLKWIQSAFRDKSTRVRRAAINGLLFYPHESSIPLLINNLKERERKKNQYYTEWVVNRYALEQLSGQFHGDNVEDWQRWWEVVKDRFTLEKRIEEELNPDDSQHGRTQVFRRDGVEILLKMKVAGRKDGYPLLVLPRGGYEPDYFRPYFHGLEDSFRVFYVQLPAIEDFKGLARDTSGSNLVHYPTQLLAKTLADLMKENGPEKFAVLAHGQGSSTLAMWAASLFPDKITHVVLISPRSAGNTYGEAIANVRRQGVARGNQEIVKGADNIQLGSDNKPKYQPSDDDEAGGIHRAIRNLRFADATIPEIGTIGYLYRLPGGTGTLNDSSWSVRKIFENQKPKLPVLVFAGEKNPWAPLGDVTRAAAAFPNAKLVKLPRSSEWPFITETYAFTAHVKAFLRDVLPADENARKGRTRTKR